MAEKKTLYHSELKKLSPVRVTVETDVLESQKKKGSYYVTLNVNGEQRYYTPENQACMDFFADKKGQTFTIVAEGGGKGSEDSALITQVGDDPAEVAARAPAPKPAAAPAPRRGPTPHSTTNAGPRPAAAAPPTPATANKPATPARMPANGARVGMAINQACAYLIAEGVPWNPKIITERASDLIRASEWLEQGHLLPPFSERQKAEQPQ
jgi:hypothetical protein